MKSDLILQSQNGISSRGQKTRQTCARVTHYNIYIQNMFGLMDQVFCIKTTLKVSENEIYNLPQEFDNIESLCLNSMTKHQEYQSFMKRNHYSSFDKLLIHIAALMNLRIFGC